MSGTMRIEGTAGRLTVAAALLLTACGGRHHLADYGFAGRSIAVVHFTPPSPELYTGGRDVSSDNALIAVIEAGSAVAVELESRRARARLDSAATTVDVATRLADRTLERAARYLGTRPVTSEREADYVLEVDVLRYGLDASGALQSAAVATPLWRAFQALPGKPRVFSTGVSNASISSPRSRAAAMASRPRWLQRTRGWCDRWRSDPCRRR